MVQFPKRRRLARNADQLYSFEVKPNIGKIILTAAVSLSIALWASIGSPQETLVREYWVDPSTGFMWASKDNGKDVSWKKAMKYCHNSRLAGYTDWSLAILSELEGIYDKKANAPGLARLGGPAKGSDFTWHVRGNLFLTGDEWSSEYRLDDRGKPSGYSWYFDFNEGRKDNEPSGWPYSSSGMRALCVRHPNE